MVLVKSPWFAHMEADILTKLLTSPFFKGDYKVLFC
jgi:hypothetical protein